MTIKKSSYFKNPSQDIAWFEAWVAQLETHNNKKYHRIQVDTSIGKTHVWGLHTHEESQETLVIFPGARTTSLFWDFDNGLDNLNCNLNIYLVETNGLPNLSDGNTPDIRLLGYGTWASEVIEKLGIQHAYIAGASFGGLICMKLAIVNPAIVKAAFLLNPGCLQPFSLKLANLYYNLLPLLAPSRKNIEAFLDKAIFCAPNHTLSAFSRKLITEYELFAITRYKDNTQKPYYMDDELTHVNVDTYLVEGNRDLLFPYAQSIHNAKAKMKTLKGIKVFENVGHGIETYHKALDFIGTTIKNAAPTG